jgi:hypothetical protein
MFRKTQIVSLILLFFVSTTGMPAFYHYCEMLGKKSLNECDMCMAEMEKTIPSCCSHEMMEHVVTISFDTPVCCQDAFVYNKVEDQYLSNKPDLNFYSLSENLIQTALLIPTSVYFYSENSFYCDSSPPFLINPDLNITNSTLLI